jgi:hypothetical protein
MRLKIFVSTIAVIHLAIQTASLAADPTEPAPPKVKVTIGKDITYITKPLRPDGYPDYVAALNEIRSRGVTRENNAAVLLQKAFGPRDTDAKFLKELGIGELPEKGDYLKIPDGIIRQWLLAWPEAERDQQYDVLYEQFDLARTHPWTTDQHPIVVQWLVLNQKPLQLVIEASRRERQFFPSIVGNDGDLSRGLLSYDQNTRYAAEALISQAMLLEGEGNSDAAWQHLLACHRLARLMNQHPSCSVESLISAKIEQLTIVADAALAHHTKLPIKRLREMQADIQALPALSALAQTLDLGERFMLLDASAHLARGSVDVLTDHGTDGKPLDVLLRALDNPAIDWNVPLRMGNEWYDRIKSTAAIADRQKRKAAIDALDGELMKLSEKIKYPRQYAWDLIVNHAGDADLSQQIGESLVVLLVPGLRMPMERQQQVELFGQMDIAALALAAYRADHGQYPEKLDSLVPEYLAAVPEDRFSADGAKIHYRREKEAYLLWSVGPNGIDDGGRDSDDNPAGDDLVLRPVPREAKAN